MKIPFLISAICLSARLCFTSIDLNSNNLSDVYEFIYFRGATAPFADPDGDRVTTYDEMFWGTNPTNAASKVTGPLLSVWQP